MLNDYFTNVIIQKVTKTKLVNNCKVYVRKKDKIMLPLNILLTNEWFDGSFWKTKEDSLKKT